jgi:hypothetical protein
MTTADCERETPRRRIDVPAAPPEGQTERWILKQKRNLFGRDNNREMNVHGRGSRRHLAACVLTEETMAPTAGIDFLPVPAGPRSSME